MSLINNYGHATKLQHHLIWAKGSKWNMRPVNIDIRPDIVIW